MKVYIVADGFIMPSLLGELEVYNNATDNVSKPSEKFTADNFDKDIVNGWLGWVSR